MIGARIPRVVSSEKLAVGVGEHVRPDLGVEELAGTGDELRVDREARDEVEATK